MFLITLMSVMAIFLLVLLLAMIFARHENPRTKLIKDLAENPRDEFLAFGSLPEVLLRRSFALFVKGHLRHARNILSQEDSGRTTIVLDYDNAGTQGLEAQTIIAIRPVTLRCGDFSLLQRTDGSFDPMSVWSGFDYKRCDPSRLTRAFAHLDVFAEHPFEVSSVLNQKIESWIHQHPSLNVELRGDTLMVYRTNHIIQPELIPSATASIQGLVADLEA